MEVLNCVGVSVLERGSCRGLRVLSPHSPVSLTVIALKVLYRTTHVPLRCQGNMSMILPGSQKTLREHIIYACHDLNSINPSYRATSSSKDTGTKLLIAALLIVVKRLMHSKCLSIQR